MTHIGESWNAKGYTPTASRTIEHIVIHHWGVPGQTHDGVLNFFCNGPGQTSAHYVVSEGRIDCIVSDNDIAWHAGNWHENSISIGIECRPEATDGDYETAAELVRTLRARYGDLPLRMHKEFHNTACPGVWDLDRLDTLARQVDKEEPEMSSAAEQRIIEYIEAAETVTRGHVNDQAKATREFVQAAHDVTRGYLSDHIKNLPAHDLAALIPDTIAADVVTALSNRLNGAQK